MTSKDLLLELEGLGVEAKNHMSVLEDDTVSLLTELFSIEDKKEVRSKPPRKEKDEEHAAEKLEKSASVKEKAKPEKEKPAESPIESRTVVLSKLEVMLKEFAELIRIPLNKIIQDAFILGEILNPNQTLDVDDCITLGKKYNIEVQLPTSEEEESKPQEAFDAQLRKYYDDLYSDPDAGLVRRTPVVTVMGHVDHGKTTLLDRIRSARVADQETGGITQAIGAYQVVYKDQKITFIDTPGHEAFTEMRARGAQATDLVILVIAADDGVMPQTIEAFNHAKEAQVPIIVAINKIDKPNANIETTKQQMATKLGLVPEDWGGDTVTVLLSAKKGEGIDDLLEMILLVSEMTQIRCYPKGKPRGIIIESGLDAKTGPTATIIIKDGVLRTGQHFVAGDTCGKVKALKNDVGKPVREARPGEPVEIMGFSDVPSSHSILYVVESPQLAKSIVEKIKLQSKAQQLKRKHLSLEEFYDIVKESDQKELRILLKADSFGTVEALKNAIAKLQTQEISIHVVHAGIGAVSPSDVLLASASDAVILGFRIKVDKKAYEEAEKERVQIKTYDIIFQLVDDLKKALQGMLEPEQVEETQGHAEIRQIFKIRRVGNIAGVQMIDGYVQKDSWVRVYRNGIEVFNGTIHTLKHFQQDAQMVEAPQECGMRLEKFDEVLEGDELEFYRIKEVERILDFKRQEPKGS
jgi:translation initiation factor IF-2